MIIDKYGRKWFKANLHTHTTDSDGQKSPEEAMRLYKDAGYDILAITDHWTCSEAQDFEGMLILRGCEYHTFTREMSHIVGVGMKNVPCPDKKADPQDIVNEINDHGGAAILAHPAWSLNTPGFIAGLEGIVGCEIYNSVSGYPYSAREYSGNVMDLASVITKKAIPPIGADDTHYYQHEIFRGFTYICMESLTRENVLKALKEGNFIASQGPFAFIEREKDETGEYAVVYCDDSVTNDSAAAVQFFSANYWNRDTTTVFAEGTTEKKARFKIKPNDFFIRAEVRTADGRFAWLYLK